MLEQLPAWLGVLLRAVRAGHAKLTIVQEDIAPGALILELSSPAFANGARLPERFTADGEGVSPPLTWRGVPEGTTSLALLVEDADAPLPNSIVHALVWKIPAQLTSLAEGAIRPDGNGRYETGDVGLNSYFNEGWLPPDPPPGHGSHDYVFQLFALSDTPKLTDSPGRSLFAKAIRGRVLAAGMLVATYSRDENVSKAASDTENATLFKPLRPA